MKPDDAPADEEARISEISILPDGRICVFGLSREVIALLGDLSFTDPALDERIEHLRALEAEKPGHLQPQEPAEAQPTAGANRPERGRSAP